jgi:hypothetical protein
VTAANGFLERYLARGWVTVPVHRPDPKTGRCSCGAACDKPGKHPDGRFWPAGTTDPAHFIDRNLGVQLGPGSANLADVDKDCDEAVLAGPYLLPPTGAAFGRGGRETHALYTIADGAGAFAKLQDPVRTGDTATIVELRWPAWDETEKRHKAIQTVFPPSLHHSGARIEWFRDGDPAAVAGADLVAAVRSLAAAVLVARYARPKERHGLVLLLANILVRAGWEDDARIVGFLTAVFAARNDPDKLAKIAAGEGLGAVKDARKRQSAGKPMTGLPALRDLLDPALTAADANKVVGKIQEWLGVPTRSGPDVVFGPTDTPEPPPWPAPLAEEAYAGVAGEIARGIAPNTEADPGAMLVQALVMFGNAIGRNAYVRVGAARHYPNEFVTLVGPTSSGRKGTR